MITTTDKKIISQLHDPQHGTWSGGGGEHSFKPHPSFFAAVEPMDLVQFFNKHAPKGAYLDMGDYE